MISLVNYEYVSENRVLLALRLIVCEVKELFYGYDDDEYGAMRLKC